MSLLEILLQVNWQNFISHEFYSPKYSQNFEKLIKNSTKLIYLESPGSLNFDVQDLEKFIHFAKNNIVTIMDNTWSTFLVVIRII